MKTPFRFKFKVIAAFNGLYDSNNYHHIRLSYYTHQSINQKSQNLYYYIPTYHLNGKTMKIIPFPLEKYLWDSSKSWTVEMKQVPGSLSWTLPTKLTMTSTSSTSTPQLPCPYAGTHHGYTEAFHTYHEVSGNYLQLGIYKGTVVWELSSTTSSTISSSPWSSVVQTSMASSSKSRSWKSIAPRSTMKPPSSACLQDLNILAQLESTQMGTATLKRVLHPTMEGQPESSSPNSPSSQATIFPLECCSKPDIVGIFPSLTFKAYGGSYSAPSR